MGDLRLAAAVLMLSTVGLAARQIPGQARPPQVPQQNQNQQPQGSIWGVVVSETTSLPVDRVELRLSGGELRGSRTVYSDISGRFAFLDLPPGAYLLRGSKTGYVDVTYGQRSPKAGRAGTPIQLLAGQQIRDLSFALPPGGVITGRVVDEQNRPSVGTTVRVMRWEYGDGGRGLSSQSSGQTDDRGIYRVYGLPPGSYIVSAMPRNTGVEGSLEMQRILEDRRTVARPVTAPDAPTLGYAPAYYPGTVDVGAAASVPVEVSEQVGGVDFVLQQVPMARVVGTVLAPPGVDPRSMRVRLNNTAQDIPGVGSLSSRVVNGTFSFPNVPPGNYRAVVTAEIDLDEREGGAPPLPQALVALAARAGPDGNDELLLWGAGDVSVSGTDVSGVSLTLQPGLTVSGRIAYDGVGQPPEAERIRVSLEPFGPEAETAGAGDSRGTVDETGRFTISGVIPARYRVEASGVSGWDVISATIGGVDAMDFGLDVSSAQDLSGLQVVFSNKRTGLSGTLQNAMGQPTADFTVVVFPSDRRYWMPGARRVQGVRPTTSGRFSFSGLPPGEYRLAAVTDVETGIWYDPSFLEQLQNASMPISLGPGQSVSQDVRVGGR